MHPTAELQEVVDVVHRLCEDTATPRSLAVAMLLRNGEWDQLVKLTVDPRCYNSPLAYYKDVCVSALLKKMVDAPTTFDRREAAVQNFWKSERDCYRSNERLSPYAFGSSDTVDRIREFLSLVRKNATQILGVRPPEECEGRFGPGSTFADRGSLATIPDKMSSHPTLTPNAASYLLFMWSQTLWAKACKANGRDPTFVRGNRFTTVPKDCRKDRGIAIEPSVNVFYQLALGRQMRKRLLRYGLDLDYAQDSHRRVACEASKDGYLCTEDLSNASDTISTNLVRLVLPPLWFEALEQLRSPLTQVDGRWLRLEKFSSMGNGYTFELETIVFYCIVAAVMETCGVKPVCHQNLYVFGDDIIFPAHLSKEVNSALRFLGLTVNEEKSFVDGRFRESCGGDYFDGVDVRPFHLKKAPHEPQEYIAFANGLWALGLKNPGDPTGPARSRRARFRVLDAIPSHIRKCVGPTQLGDLVLHDEEARWRFRWRSSIRYFQCYRPADFKKVGWKHFTSEVILASAVYGTGSGLPTGRPWSSSLGGITPRDAVLGYKIGWVPSS